MLDRYDRLRERLEALYESYDFRGRAARDPIRVPMRYKEKGDMEAAGFIASCLAYGRVGLFLPVVEGILRKMGGSPYEFLMGFDAARDGKLFRGIKYRLNTTEDIICLLHVTGRLLKRHGGLERAFLNHYGRDDPDTGNALAGLVEEAMGIDASPVYGRGLRPGRGFRFFFPSPRDGSACKRLNLFLRWMVRRADIDLGLWREVPPDKLIIPLDAHIARVSRCMGLTRRRTDDWKTASEITRALRILDPLDPLKYDFVLCHRGISGVCSEEACGACGLRAGRHGLGG